MALPAPFSEEAQASVSAEDTVFGVDTPQNLQPAPKRSRCMALA